MTELEKTERAKMYIDKLANGINPLTDEEMGGNETLNNVRISRCLFYVSELLGKIIANGGEVGGRITVQKASFSITEEQIAEIEITDEPVGIASFAKRINSVLSPDAKGIAAVTITAWLLKNGFLEENIRNGKREKIPTAKGTSLGITTVEGVNMQGIAYRKNLYNRAAQQFIADNLINIALDMQ